MKRTVKILSKKELKVRYPKGMKTNMANLTREALEKGYSIALIEQEGMCSKTLTHDVQAALESITPKTSVVEVWGYTDMSELLQGKIYCAFKELKGMATAHSITHCRIS